MSPWFRDVNMVYKCQHGLAPDYLASKLVKRFNIHNYNTRQKDNINIEFRRTSIAKRSFFDHTLNLWNKLSDETKIIVQVLIV